MSGWYEHALEKLDKGAKEIKGNKAIAMKNAVKDTLLDFCRQNGEFAQAVVQGGTFSECMDAVAKGVGSSISDLDAYKRAVSFYFPGAEVLMQMRIRLEPAEEAEDLERGGGLLLNFSDFWRGGEDNG